MKVVHTENAPAPIGPYSQAIVHGEILFTAGQIGLDSAGIHADNTPVSCMDFSLPFDARANCTKHWYGALPS